MFFYYVRLHLSYFISLYPQAERFLFENTVTCSVANRYIFMQFRRNLFKRENIRFNTCIFMKHVLIN